MAKNKVKISDDSIKLGKFLKLADVADSGSDAKDLLVSGVVHVNGKSEARRGRKLEVGDVVTVAKHDYKVVSG